MNALGHRDDCECGECWPVVYASPPLVVVAARAVTIIHPLGFPVTLQPYCGLSAEYFVPARQHR